jgi:arginase
LIADSVRDALEQGCFPVVLGGDHSLAIGSVAGAASYYRMRGKKIGLIWMDAHPDMNTPLTSPTGNIHGMPLAFCLGCRAEELSIASEAATTELSNLLGFSPKVNGRNVALIGARDFDPGEKDRVEKEGVTWFRSAQCTETDIRGTMEKAIALVCEGTDGFHLSFDIDFLDPTEAPGVGTPYPDGATKTAAQIGLEAAAASGRMVSMDVVEVNPLLEDKDPEKRTVPLAIELMLSALGALTPR